jgi:hypothetical protein
MAEADPVVLPATYPVWARPNLEHSDVCTFRIQFWVAFLRISWNSATIYRHKP